MLHLFDSLRVISLVVVVKVPFETDQDMEVALNESQGARDAKAFCYSETCVVKHFLEE